MVVPDALSINQSLTGLENNTCVPKSMFSYKYIYKELGIIRENGLPAVVQPLLERI